VCVLQVTAEQNVIAPHQPMFITELMLDTHSLSYQPSIDDFQVCVFRHTISFCVFCANIAACPVCICVHYSMLMLSMCLCEHQECVAEITGRFEKTVLSLDNLVQDTYFDAFTQPIINKKVKLDQHLPLQCIVHALL